jgi:subtilisin family serine protease
MLEILDRLGAARGKNVRVAVVDSGVEPNHSWVGGRLAASYSVIRSGGDYQLLKCNGGDLMGHGTAVSGQVRRFAPDVDIVSVQILGGGLRADSEALLRALGWLVTQDVSIINLSLSTMREKLALRIGHAIDDLSAAGVAVVCARGYHSSGRAYPTDFASTIAVNYKDLHPARIEFRPRDAVEFDAAGAQIEIAWKSTPEMPDATRVAEGSSFACPLVTGLAARMLSVEPGLEPYELKTLLKAYALRQADGWWEDWMDQVDEVPV